MEYAKKIKRIEDHVQRFPADYQSQIALMKARSDAIEHEYHKERIVKLRKVAECRRLLNEQEHSQQRLDG